MRGVRTRHRCITAVVGLGVVVAAACTPDPTEGVAQTGDLDSGLETGSGPSTGGTTDAGSTGTTAETAGDDSGSGGASTPLRLNDIQAKGTHNSYHVAPEAGAPFWAYTMAPLDVQLGEQGVRQFELDVHYEPDGGFTVSHVPLDNGTTCEYFVDCLQTMRDWSVANPEHHVLFIFVEPKDDFDQESIVGHYDELDAEIRSVWPPESLVTPDDVRGEHPDLRTALMADGWPTIDSTRGKALFVFFDAGVHRDGYVEDAPTLVGKPMFIRGGLDDANGGIVKMDDPVAEAEDIVAAVEAGLIVRTRADTDLVEPLAGDLSRFEMALQSGAQLVSTDVPVPVPEYDYEIVIPEGTPTRCNPLVAPADCTAARIEAL